MLTGDYVWVLHERSMEIWLQMAPPLGRLAEFPQASPPRHRPHNSCPETTPHNGVPHSLFAAYLLSCRFPRRPSYGDVTVTSLHPGGSARFHCATGYQLKGARFMTCLNATQPFWDSREPVCIGEWPQETGLRTGGRTAVETHPTPGGCLALSLVLL